MNNVQFEKISYFVSENELSFHIVFFFFFFFAAFYSNKWDEAAYLWLQLPSLLSFDCLLSFFFNSFVDVDYK